MIKLGSINMDVDAFTGSLLHDGTGTHNHPLNSITYTKLIMRFLELLDRHDIRATFFVVGKDLTKKENRRIARTIVEAGHEIANHTMNHWQWFSTLKKKEKEEEITSGQKIIEDTVGKPVKGFRAPGYTIDREILDILRDCGYSYDLSVNTSLFYLLAKYIYSFYFLDKNHKRYLTYQNPRIYFAPTLPYYPDTDVYVQSDKLGLLEIPINVVPILNVPCVSWITTNTMLNTVFYWTIKNTNQVLNFELHDFEFISHEDIGPLESSFSLQRMLKTSLKERMERLSDRFERFKKDYQLLTMSEIAEKINASACVKG